jgi:hypothetical protein
LALAAVLLAAAKVNFPFPNDEKQLFQFDELFKAHLRRCPTTDTTTYHNSHWVWKIDERIDEKDLYECIK